MSIATTLRYPIRLLSVTGLLLAAACGGSSGDNQQEQLAGLTTLRSIASMDGSFNPFAPVVSTGAEPSVGDDANNDNLWGFVTFDLSAIPQNATIRSARVELWQRTVEGNGFGVVSLVLLDHMEVDPAGLDWGDLLGNELEAPITNGGGQPMILSSNANNGVRTMDVTRQVRNDVNNARRYCQFRIRGLDGNTLRNGQPDRVIYTDAENQRGGQPPRLVVDWE